MLLKDSVGGLGMLCPTEKSCTAGCVAGDPRHHNATGETPGILHPVSPYCIFWDKIGPFANIDKRFYDFYVDN